MSRALLLLVLLALPHAGHAAVEGCGEELVLQARLEGCEGACVSRGPLMRLLSIVRLGEPLSDARLTRLERGLETARLAKRATFRCEAMDGGVRFVMTVTPMTYIRRVRVEGNDAFRRKEILKRVFLRPGTALDVDPLAPELNPQIVRQQESLKRLYTQAGLGQVDIRIRIVPVDDSFIDIALVIAEGDRLKIEDVRAVHIHRGRRDDDGLSCPTLGQKRLERLIGLGIGDTWTTLTERQLKERLRKSFQAAGFVRPVITIPPLDETGVLEVKVETNQCWVIRLWQRDLARSALDDAMSFRWSDPLRPRQGSEEHQRALRTEASWQRVEASDWTDILPFGESGSFEREEAIRGLDKVRGALLGRGFPFAEVSVEHRDLKGRLDRRPQESEVAGVIDYFMTLNLERRIQNIRFEGAQSFTHDTLHSVMSTKSYDFFGSGGGFDPARVEADMLTLAEYYRERGYGEISFLPPTPTPTLEHFAFDREKTPYLLEKSPSSPHFTLVIAIDEGSPTTLETILIEGPDESEWARIERILGLQKGTPFGPLTMREAIERLTRDYESRGFHHMSLRARCLENTSEVPCGQRTEDGSQSLALAIDEGPVVKVGAVVWRGNAETSPHVIVRDLPRPGDILDLDRINRAVRRMRALGIFNSVRVDIEGLDDRTSDEVLLIVAVEEAEFRFLDVAVGLRSIQRANIGRVPAWAASGAGILVDQADRVSSGLGRTFVLDIPDLLLTFDFEYLDLNSLGIGNQVRIPFVAGFSLSQFLRLATFNPSYTMPRLLDSDLQLTTRGIAELDRVTSPLDRLELGLEGELLVPIREGMSAGFLARAGVIQLQAPSADCVYCLTGPAIAAGTATTQDAVEAAADAVICAGDPNAPGCADLGFRPQFTLGARWRFDTQDTPLHPTRGIALAASTSFILDRDRLSSAPIFNQFLKWEASARAALSLQSIVLAGFVRYGGSATFGEDFLPADERFTLGGSNGMRGFADNGICRYDADGNLDPTCATEFGGNVVLQGSLELRLPLVPSIGLWLGTFLDIGALAKDHDTLHLESFRVSSGLGLRWLLGDLFPIRLDIGFPLVERRCVSYQEDGSCTLEEPSQVHFGLLYTF
jgi:outer membrane protein assembly factor BamA